jgi:hypothetical protein
MMRYLIDGYNLLYAMGLVRGRAGPAGLEKARNRLVGLLGWTYEHEPAELTVVFDAADAPPDVPTECTHRNVRVRFAVGRAEADDLIEELIRHDAAPRQLAVVSDDHRLRQAARQRHARAVSCSEYLDELDRRRSSKRQPPPPAAKPDHLTRQETEHWLREFADLADGPDWKELFDCPEVE